MLLEQPHDHTLFGTTFPPSRHLLQKFQVHKYHSETDLVKAQDNDDSGTCPQAELEQSTKEKSRENKEELTDSDLFFDFDIESPHEAIEHGDENEKVILNADSSLDCQEIRRSSESSLESVTMTGKFNDKNLTHSFPKTNFDATRIFSLINCYFSTTEMSKIKKLGQYLCSVCSV